MSEIKINRLSDQYDMFLPNPKSLEIEIDILFEKYNELTLSQIKKLLKDKGYECDDTDLLYAINSLLVHRGVIVRKDFWNQEPQYVRLDNYRVSSSYSKHYYSFEVDDYETKKFLLIADTHIGNIEMEDFLLLHSLYDYGIKVGATKCFHLGDVFAGETESKNFDLAAKKAQIMRFAENYPKPNLTEMRTYGSLGNHDLQIDEGSWHSGYSNYYYDLRELNYLNPSFYVFPRENWMTDFLDRSFHFSHRFHHSNMLPNLKVTCEKDILKEKGWLDWHYDVKISAHLHRGLIYGADPSKFVCSQQIFLGVPSTSKFNTNRAVAYLVTLNYDNCTTVTSMDVSVLSCDSNYNIGEMDAINWSFIENNDVYKKIKIYE